MIRLYHGTNKVFEHIDLTKCRPYKDFGRGIYLTQLEVQAREWAVKVVERSDAGKPVVLVFDFDDAGAESLNTLVFETPDTRWAQLIMNNRNRNWIEDSDPLSNHDSKYDIVEGPVANDDIATTFSLYVRGILNSEQLAQQLAYKQLNHQISFHTERSLLLLKQVSHYGLD